MNLTSIFLVGTYLQAGDVPQDVINNYESSKYLRDGVPFLFSQISCEKLEKILYKIKSNAVGSDGFNIKMILYIIPHLSNHLTYIINKCLLDGTFPFTWKEANVIPVAKKNCPTLINHFRPISLLPVLSKVLEKIVSEQINDHLNNNLILPISQSGFRARHSTTTALLKVSDDIFSACDNNQNSCLILLDYSKAFDTLDHATLCAKLKYYGFGVTATSFFHNYLNNRRQKVILNDNISNTLSISRGVPQGSVLGPLLFSIYTADLNKCLQFCTSHQYADDTQIYYSFSLFDLDTAVLKINSDLDKISKFSADHGLVLNEVKTELLVFGKHKAQIIDNPNFKIVLNNQLLSPVNACKNLGVWFDTDLRFVKHVSTLIQKSISKLKLLYIHKDILSTEVKLRLTDSLLLSSISYCDTVYWPAILNRDKESLQRIQNSCIRLSYNLRKFDHITYHFKQSKWLSLSERFECHLACLIFKIIKCESPSYLLSKLKKGSDTHQRSTRHCSQFTVPKHRSALFQRSFSYTAAKLYNSLPLNIKSCTNIVSFRKQITTFIINKRII